MAVSRWLDWFVSETSLFFEAFYFLFYLGNYFFVPNLFSFPDLG
jgi:hypothetical protein